MEHFRQKLKEERERYEGLIRAINDSGLGMSFRDTWVEDSMYDNHPGDLGTEMFERSKDLSLRANADRFLNRIDDAMERLQGGMYGVCEECGQPIPPERLEVFPSTPLCVACKSRREGAADRFHRPVEEKVLNPPFGRTFNDDSDWPIYDGEDAWQDVGDYGTSETPQDVPGAIKYTDLYHSGEHVYTVVEDLEGMIDEEGEPLDDTGEDRADPTDWHTDEGDPFYDTDGNMRRRR